MRDGTLVTFRSCIYASGRCASRLYEDGNVVFRVGTRRTNAGAGEPPLRHVEAGDAIADGAEKVGGDGVDAPGDLIGSEDALAVSPVYCTHFT
jgi:hypothetical protein